MMMDNTYKNQMERVKVNIISIGRDGAEVDRAGPPGWRAVPLVKRKG